jgi:menaquinone-specific isochorismate synthase
MADAALVARTRRLDVDLDAIEVAGPDGLVFDRGRHGFAGRGSAVIATISGDERADPARAAAAVAEVLDAIVRDDDVGLPGCGPVALGALPFDRHRDALLTVPAVLVGRAADGTRWCTTVLPVDAAPDDHDRLRDEVVESAQTSRAPVVDVHDFHIHSSRPAADWQAAIVAARDELRTGTARKVVLAREVIVRADTPIERRAVLQRLRASYPACVLFAFGSFVGATPELLVSRTGDIVRAQPMAGTAPRSADPTTDARLAAALLSSAKDLAEHRYTIDMVHDTLLPFCSYLDEEAEPSIVAVANVQHLATTVEGRLSAPAASVIELMTGLHPTPAVGGLPREGALAMIERYEELDRGHYAGPVGWVDGQGNGEWAVGIRCAEIDGATARLVAGVGVVADSDPDAELAETQAKLQALLAAVIRP